MTNREKFKEVFGKDIKWSEAIEPQMLALKSAQINGIDCMEEWLNAEYKEPTTKNELALLERTYDDFCKCEGGEGWLKIDGEAYDTDAGYALEGMRIFMEVFKRRLAELPPVTPQNQVYPLCEDCHTKMDEVRRAYDNAMKQEQEPILDKIRAEITDCLKALDEIEKSGLNIYLPNEISGRRLTYQQCLKFIDKYKTESEE